MKISQRLNDAINKQIGEELKASNAYANMAAYFNSLGLLKLTAMFLDQSEEEREHAMKFLHYLMEVDGKVAIPAIPEVPHHYESVKAAFESALGWEKDVTAKIDNLMDLAVEDKDYAAQDFLRWYVTEQVEEEATMSHLVLVAEALEDRTPLMIENHLPAD
jgi:ferritin